MTEWDQASADYAIGVAKELHRAKAGVFDAHWHVLAGILQKVMRGDVSFSDKRFLLDVGSGAGHAEIIMTALAGDQLSYFGYEPSEKMRVVAQKLCPDVGISEMDILELPDQAKERWAEVVMSNGTLNHISEWRAALVNMAALSTKYVLLHRLWVYMDDSPSTGIIKQAYGQNIWHMRINEKEMVKLLAKKGFELQQKLSSDGSGEPQAGWTYLFQRT